MRIALLMVCLNQPYWPYIEPTVSTARQHFLKDHDIDMFLWSDLPSLFPETTYGCTVFETESVRWPLPTLMRYHLFLQQEEKLKEYDYIFYVDVDMKFVSDVGEEVLGDGLTAAQHPGYAIQRAFQEPYEANPDSAAYIPQSGTYAVEEGKNVFKPLYAAGGFQGGKSADFIKAMKVMKRAIDDDFNKNYIARWNDESHWNRYLFDNPPAVVLDPGYVYPDNSIAEYYIKVWGRDYPKKILTLTKPFSLSKSGGDGFRSVISNL